MGCCWTSLSTLGFPGWLLLDGEPALRQKKIARFLSNESSDADDLDELFTPSDLEADEDEDDNDLVPRNAADGSDDESSAEVGVSVASSLEKWSRTMSPSSPPAKRSQRSDRSVNGIYLRWILRISQRWSFLHRPGRSL